jgi:hypothetical protein
MTFVKWFTVQWTSLLITCVTSRWHFRAETCGQHFKIKCIYLNNIKILKLILVNRMQ